MSRKLVPVVAVLVALGAEFALAKTVACTMASMERTVELRYDNPGEAVPCEIRYAKPTEGVGEEVLWRAENEAGYCEARFQAFVDKLRGFGWSCGEPVGDPTATGADEVADEPTPENAPEEAADEPAPTAEGADEASQTAEPDAVEAPTTE